MTDEIKKNDFIEIEYTGLIAEPEEAVFDTTDEKLAKEKGIHNPNMIYGPIVICVGEQQILKGLDSKLEGKAPGRQYTVELGPEEAFGKKDASMLKLIPLSAFKKQNVNPVPGLQINIDNMVGTVKTISGGRVIVDFNHPLAGKKVNYKIKINKKITNKAEQIKSYLMLKLNLKPEAFKVDISGDTASLEFKSEIPENLQKVIKDKLTELVKVKDVKFGIIKQSKEQESSKEQKQEQNKKQESKQGSNKKEN